MAANDFYFSLMEASQYIDKNSDIAFGSGADDVSDGSYLAPVNSDDWDEPWKFIQSTSYLLKKAEESGLTDDEIVGVNIPTGVPLVYEFDENFDVISKRYLGDEDALKAKMDAVANQGRAR
ncbi:MAG: hypothetical protein A3208_01620 [Candidatus Methanoprimaticola hominis]|nr:MAG: hypothetical protein A3208_01620 [Methanomassiliicoccales archaeon Mx-06]